MYLEGDSISTLKYSILYLESDMLFRIRYYIPTYILNLVRTDVPNCMTSRLEVIKPHLLYTYN